MPGRQRAAGDQPAAADRHQQIVERPGLLEQLLRRRALAGDDMRMVERRNEDQVPFLLDSRRHLLAPLVLPVQNDLGAIAPRPLELHPRRVPGHDDHRPDAEHLPGERHGLRVVTR
jgi:hypothetical protein